MEMNHDLCLLAVTYIKTSIDDNASLEDVLSGLSELSTSIFADGQSPLEDFVHEYLPQIIHHLENNLTPEEVCTALCF